VNRQQRRAAAKQGQRNLGLSPQTKPAGVSDLFAAGVAHHKAGRLAQAEACYRQVLAAQSDHADALQLLGLMAHQVGRHDVAVDLITQAIRRDATKPGYFSNLGSALEHQGRIDEAVAAYRKAIQLKPDFAEAYCNLSGSLLGHGKIHEAVAAGGEAIRINPDLAEAHAALGRALRQSGELDKAVAAFLQAIRIRADYAEAHSHLGTALDEQGKLVDAVAAFREAIRIKPDFAEAYCNLGNSLRRQGKLDEAMAACREAIRIKPGLAPAHANLGNLLRETGELDAAVAACETAIRINPMLAGAHCNLGTALYDQGKLDEAVAAYGRALSLQPGKADALLNLAIALTDLGRLDEALAFYEQTLTATTDFFGVEDKLGFALFEQGRIAEALACYRRGLARHPAAPGTLINYAVALSNYGRHEEAIASFRLAMEAAPDDPTPHSGLIFALNFDPAATAVEHQAERSRWDERHARRFAPWGGHDNDPDPHRRLRIGYVSRYFCSQAATYAFGGVIMCHDPDRFEIVCYSDTEQEDDVTRHLRGRADVWHDTAELGDEALTGLIRADRIDILVDLVGHMRGHRLLAFARKPAPIQVTGWGEPTGTGLAAMDYLFADPVLVPPAERGLLAEKVVDLPNFLGYWVPDPIPEPRALPALDRGYVTLGSFSRFDKIQEPVLIGWARIMNALAGSRLVLKEGRACVDPSQRERITSVLGANGIDAERVTFLGSLNRVGHFEAYHAIDLALDPFPHGGGMTTIDALWMGVPVVTFSGHTISSRLASATLSAAGLTDFIAPDLDGYVDLAVNMMSDLAALARLRATLRGRVASSAFGDPARYARAVEAAYRTMWQRWCAARSASSDTAPRELRP
jgi:protein O-GlcNAc transferase